MAGRHAGKAKVQQHQFKPSRKNGWDEHRPVIFRKPTHLHTENEGWPRRRRGEGTYIGDGSDVLTDPELAGHRWLP